MHIDQTKEKQKMAEQFIKYFRSDFPGATSDLLNMLGYKRLIKMKSEKISIIQKIAGTKTWTKSPGNNNLHSGILNGIAMKKMKALVTIYQNSIDHGMAPVNER